MKEVLTVISMAMLINGMITATLLSVPMVFLCERSDMVLLGNNQPKWMMGWSNTLSYKNFVLNFMFDMRYGGDVYMGSIRAGASSGNLEMTLDGRDGMVVPGVLADGTPEYEEYYVLKLIGMVFLAIM